MIAVCEEWNDSFISFRDWAIDNLYEDHLTIDRIDNNGNYEPKNCRWISMKNQNRNTRSNVRIDGELVMDISKKLGGKRELVTSRLRRYNWDINRAINTPVRDKVIYKGELSSVASIRLGGDRHLVSKRIKDGWNIRKAFNTPVIKKYQHKHQ